MLGACQTTFFWPLAPSSLAPLRSGPPEQPQSRSSRTSQKCLARDMQHNMQRAFGNLLFICSSVEGLVLGSVWLAGRSTFGPLGPSIWGLIWGLKSGAFTQKERAMHAPGTPQASTLMSTTTPHSVMFLESDHSGRLFAATSDLNMRSTYWRV